LTHHNGEKNSKKRKTAGKSGAATLVAIDNPDDADHYPADQPPASPIGDATLKAKMAGAAAPFAGENEKKYKDKSKDRS